MKRTTFVVLLALLAGCSSTKVTLCGPGQTFALNTDVGDPRAGPAKVASLSAPPAPLPAEPPPGTKRIKVYFVSTAKPDADGCPMTQSVERDVSPAPSLAAAAIQELIKGPTPQERASGLLSAADPSGTELKDVALRGDLAEVRFTKLRTVASDACTRSALRKQIISTTRGLSLANVTKVGITLGEKDWR